MGELLTETEKDVIAQAGKLYTRIANEIIGHGPTRDADIAELAAAIHVIQHMVMSQAAARRYPELFRLLGGTVPERPRPEANFGLG
jgi:hypothetical protein